MGMSTYYKRLREKIGNDLILVPSVAAIIRNTDGEILFQNKGNGEKWSLPAGAIEPGETPAKALVREVREETGLIVFPRELIGVFGGKEFRYQYPNGHKVEYIIHMFECEIKGGKIGPKDDETAELRYFRPQNKPELALPYPESIFINDSQDQAFIQWDDLWMKADS